MPLSYPASARPPLTLVELVPTTRAIRTYFASHTDQWQQLQGIANPLRTLRNSCPQQVSAGDVARLFDAMSA